MRAARLVRFIIRRVSLVELLTRRGRTGASRGDWPAAATAYGWAVTLCPRRAPLLVQWGHALKETGRAEAAIAAYRRASLLAPVDVDVRLHLAAMLRPRAADRDEAHGLYRDILLLEPQNGEALRSLIELGGRSLVPERVLVGDVVQARQMDVAAARDALRSAEREAEKLSAFPLPLYSLFRDRHPLAPPPKIGKRRPVVAVLAAGCSAAMLDATMVSLTRQSLPPAEIVVIGSGELLDHPAASLVYGGLTSTRLSLADAAASLRDIPTVVVVPAGVALDDHAVAWLMFALDRTGTVTVYGDHDEVTEDAKRGRRHAVPTLFGAHDPIMVKHADQPPLAVLTSGPALSAALSDRRSGWTAIAAVVEASPDAVHLPRVIASRHRLPIGVWSAPGDARQVHEAVLDDDWRPAAPASASGRRAAIAVIIPTRDHAALLRRTIDSLVAAATSPERLEFIILDNRSREPETHTLLASLREQGARVIVHDEPFNWSRANNIGAAAAMADLLVFANNDLEASSLGWDDVVEQRLSYSGTGVVGARLFYPDRCYQHAGVVLGVGCDTLTGHEGVGHPSSERGPNGRWVAARRVSAVTGAFMACKKSMLAAADGFDEGLAIAYNDLDFCLKVRALGKAVLYDPQLCLVHHESKTRGHNSTQDKLYWDERERIAFMQRWSAKTLWRDPGYNPQWSRDGLPFDAIREPPLDEIVAWIDAGARHPWHAQRPGNAGYLTTQ